MNLFISLLCGFIGIPFIFLFFMGAAFAGPGIFQAFGEDLPPVVDIIFSNLLLIVIPLVLLGLHIYGQKLWWSDQYVGGYWLPIGLMLSAIPALILLFAVFTLLPNGSGS